MNTLIEDLLATLREHSLVKNTRIVNYDETPAGKLEVKIRCQLIKNYQFQIWLHIEPTLQDYAYQLFTNQPLLRWDNAPHYPHIATAPHHFHDKDNRVGESPLTGEVRRDLLIVLAHVKQWLASQDDSIQ
jgi:hypothetical protein